MPTSAYQRRRGTTENIQSLVTAYLTSVGRSIQGRTLQLISESERIYTAVLEIPQVLIHIELSMFT